MSDTLDYFPLDFMILREICCKKSFLNYMILKSSGFQLIAFLCPMKFSCWEHQTGAMLTSSGMGNPLEMPVFSWLS